MTSAGNSTLSSPSNPLVDHKTTTTTTMPAPLHLPQTRAGALQALLDTNQALFLIILHLQTTTTTMPAPLHLPQTCAGALQAPLDTNQALFLIILHLQTTTTTMPAPLHLPQTHAGALQAPPLLPSTHPQQPSLHLSQKVCEYNIA